MGIPNITEVSTATLIGRLIKLDRPIDRQQPCCGNVAIIGSSSPLHAARLICESCGTFRGWLPAMAATFLIEASQTFEPGELPVLQNPILTMEELMAKDATKQFDDDNTGVLYRNKFKTTGDRRPEYTGSAIVNGRVTKVSGWIRESKKSEKFMSLAFRPKTESRQ